MAEKFTTLHPLGDQSTDIYPNIKADSIIEPIPTDKLASHIYEHTIILRTATGMFMFAILCNREEPFSMATFTADVFAILGNTNILANGMATNERAGTFLVGFVLFSETSVTCYDAGRNISNEYSLGQFVIAGERVRRLL